MSAADRADERMFWVLREIAATGGHVAAWHAKTVDKFVKAFPEAERTLVIYSLGANVSPMLNRAAQRAFRLGYIAPGSIGNTDARNYNQRTWARTWTLTLHGHAALQQRNAA